MPRREQGSPIIRKGKTWYVEWYFTTPDGTKNRIRRSKTDTGVELNSIANIRERTAAAEKLLQQIKMKLAPVMDDPTHEPVAAALDIAVGLKRSDKEKTMKTFRETARWFCEFLDLKGWGSIRCFQLTQEMVQAYFDYIIVKRRVANSTHNTRKNNLRSLFSELVKRKYIPENYVKAIVDRPEGAPIRRPMSEREFNIYIEYVAANDRALYLCSILLGFLAIRPGEERDLRVGAIDLDSGLVRFPGSDSKNRADSTVTIPTDILQVLESFGLRKYPEGYYIFGRGKGRHNKHLLPGPERVGENTLSERFRVALGRLKKAGKIHNTKGLQLYSLKDTLALYLLNNGVDVVSAMHHFRQNSLEVFQRYVKRLGVVNQKIKALPVRNLPGVK